MDDKAQFHHSSIKMSVSDNLKKNNKKKKSEMPITTIPVPSGATITKSMQLN